MRANAPLRSSSQTLVLQVRDRIGVVQESEARFSWQKQGERESRALLRIVKPVDMRGAGLLVIEEGDRRDLFMYMPELRRVRRVTGRMAAGALFGSDFGIDELEQISGIGETISVEHLRDDDLDGRPVHVVSHRLDRSEGGAFERIVAFVDRETCVPLRAEFLEPGGRLRKVLTVEPSDLAREGARWVARRSLVRDLRDETETELVVREIEFDAEIPRRTFTHRELERGL